ncbi:phosphoenolpyruvate carboxykinase (ATP), partial [Vibrio parahaemolyticus]
VRVINELAWHSLFIRTLLVRPGADELAGFTPEYTIIDLPSFRADPARHGSRSETVIAVNFTEKLILIGGTAYAGEMKKSVFGL